MRSGHPAPCLYGPVALPVGLPTIKHDAKQSHFIRTLDHAAVYAWGETTHEYPLEDTRPHPDAFLNRSWGLLHQAGIYTAPHHDSNGRITFVRIVSGMKMWAVYDLEDTSASRDEASDAFYRLCDIDSDLSQLPKGLVAEVVVLHAGDML